MLGIDGLRRFIYVDHENATSRHCFLARNCIDFGNESSGMKIGLIQFVLGLFVSETFFYN